MDNNKPTHIIFDLGGVLINLDMPRTFKAFQELAPQSEVNWKEMLHHPIPLRYEQGFISDAEFRDGLREILKANVSDEQIDWAWNQMILDFPEDRFPLLEELAEKYVVLLLSNTNDIHLRYVHSKVQEMGYEELDQFFTKAHYSHRMGLRKPDQAIYQAVLAEHDIRGAQALFIDDNPFNIRAAGEMGIQTHHLTDINTLPDFISSRLL
ncbi:HAD family hydrolase [Fulvivirga sedimenti]|uniref:HAD family phosphatase n=1 Tax=Fulvivirga sedimenti TaxID=2879465 RepID=A0A9X1KYJ8_9BACT|nr:HAD family phosphatase [Fulvivirga sedimenti]MCA6076067.1 HAD family phosphatase [Fulvivirga sedimenti]MCA6077195.1 HAD family phosphatase [Fulvivirga sedimenti]